MPSVKIIVNCTHCNQEFSRGKYDVQRTLKRCGAVFCSIKCHKIYFKEKTLAQGFAATKVCTKCNCEKPRTSEYFPLNRKTLDKFDSWCKNCRATYRSEIRRGMYREMISDADLKELLKIKQCIICGSEENLVVDHCHKTNTVRGVLCNHCNRGLGHFRDDPFLLEFARIYLMSISSDPEYIEEFNTYLKTNSVLPIKRWNC